jgi:hypothetical protein
MVPASAHPLAQDQPNSSPYAYARVLGIYHANIICVGSGNVNTNPIRIDFLWVCWYCLLLASDPFCLDKLAFAPLSKSFSTGFLDPATTVRSCHIIPDFTLGAQRTSQGYIPLVLAQTRNDWVEYYINQYVFFFLWSHVRRP